MDNEQPAEQAPEKTEEQKEIEAHVEAMRQKYALADAIRDYHKAEIEANKASKRFSEAREVLRSKLAKGSRYIVKIDFSKYLVSCDKNGYFEITPIEELN